MVACYTYVKKMTITKALGFSFWSKIAHMLFNWEGNFNWESKHVKIGKFQFVAFDKKVPCVKNEAIYAISNGTLPLKSVVRLLGSSIFLSYTVQWLHSWSETTWLLCRSSLSFFIPWQPLNLLILRYRIACPNSPNAIIFKGHYRIKYFRIRCFYIFLTMAVVVVLFTERRGRGTKEGPSFHTAISPGTPP